MTWFIITAREAKKRTRNARRNLELVWMPLLDQKASKWLYGGGGISFQLKLDSLLHAHAQTTKTYYKHQDSRIKKGQELKTKTSANFDIPQTLINKQDIPSRYQVYQGRLLTSFQDDAKYEHVGQDTRSQGGKDETKG
ncbi:hypothetical protein Tco_0540250 [Tanacetum coccineum]